jgi:hypothetical protein
VTDGLLGTPISFPERHWGKRNCSVLFFALAHFQDFSLIGQFLQEALMQYPFARRSR